MGFPHAIITRYTHTHEMPRAELYLSMYRPRLTRVSGYMDGR